MRFGWQTVSYRQAEIFNCDKMAASCNWGVLRERSTHFVSGRPVIAEVRELGGDLGRKSPYTRIVFGLTFDIGLCGDLSDECELPDTQLGYTSAGMRRVRCNLSRMCLKLCAVRWG